MDFSFSDLNFNSIEKLIFDNSRFADQPSNFCSSVLSR